MFLTFSYISLDHSIKFLTYYNTRTTRHMRKNEQLFILKKTKQLFYLDHLYQTHLKNCNLYGMCLMA